MQKILVPVDGSTHAMGAVRHVVAEYQRHRDLEVHLLNVQLRLPYHVTRFLDRSARHDWARQRAEAALAAAQDLLRQSGVPFVSHWASGERVATICDTAQRLGAHHIVLGSARHRPLARMLENSVTFRLLDLSAVPVEVVAGGAAPRWQAWGLPTGAMLAGAGLLWLAAACWQRATAREWATSMKFRGRSVGQIA
jgi:nucleotide-binding universal stress UspA family protein